MAFDEYIANLLVDLCRRMKPYVRLSVRLSFFTLSMFMFVSIFYVSVNFTLMHMTYDSQADAARSAFEVFDVSTCMTEAEFAEQLAKEANGTGLGPPPKTGQPEGPRLPWKHWNWCTPRPANFTYRIQEKAFCQNRPVQVLRFVVSGLERRDERDQIRNKVPLAGLRTLFLLGTPEEMDKATQYEILAESEEHHDILQPEVRETEENASLRILAALHWAVTRCAHAKAIYRTGDAERDKHAHKVVAITDPEREKEPPAAVGQIYCAQLSNIIAKVLRKEDHPPGAKPHWLTSYTEYPEEYFPQYCLNSYAVTVPMAKRLLEMWTWSRYFKLEGVYITGILPLMMGNATRVVM